MEILLTSIIILTWETQQKVDLDPEFVNWKTDLFSDVLEDKKVKTAQDWEPTAIKVRPTPQAKKKAQDRYQNKKNAKVYPQTPGIRKSLPKINAWAYTMKGAAKGCVDRYLELSGLQESSLKPVATPNIEDHLLNPSDFDNKGLLAKCCSKAVLKCLYMTRLARPELYWTVNTLAREVTKWNVACDKRLHRLISYIHCKKDAYIVSYIGDKASECKLGLFVDASFAAD